MPAQKAFKSLCGLNMRIIRPGVRIIKRCMTFLTILFLTGLITASESSGQDQPTVISNVKVEPSPFSPNDDGINETTKFSFTLSEPSSVAVEILFFSDSVTVGGINLFLGPLTDTLVLGDDEIPFGSDTVYYTTESVAGLNEFIWDGVIQHNLTKGEIQLPDSTYTYMIRAEDKDTDDQFRSRPVTGTVTIDSRPPVISSVSVSPNPFSPNNDNLNDFARIRFSLNGLPQNATVGTLAFKISLDINGNPFFELDNANTTNEFYTSDSLPVPFAPIPIQFIKRSLNKENISFSIRGRRVLASGDVIEVSTSAITIIPGDPVGTAYPDPNGTLFSFIDQVEGVNGSPAENAGNTVEVRTAAGAVRVDVRNSLNQVVASNLPLDPPFIGNGVYTASFGPGPLDDGVYTYQITAVDESGNQTQVTGTVTAQSNPITIAGLQAVPDTVSPADGNNKFDLSAISYNLQNRPGNVTLQIFRDSTAFVSNNLVRTMFSNTAQQEGPHTEIWDGRNDSGEYVSAGQEKAYRVIVSAFDPQTFETTEARTVIFVDNLPPQALQLDPLPLQTQDANITLSGRSDPGDSVVVFLNGNALEPPALDPDFGFFEIQLNLQGGINQVYAVAFDRVKNGPSSSNTIQVELDVGEPGPGPNLVSVTAVTARNGFLNSLLDQQAGQQWAFDVVVGDSSGTGIDPNRSGLELVFLATRDTLAGTFSVEGATLSLQVTDNIATDGSMDGEFRLFITADDRDPTTATLVDSVKFLNDTRAPDIAQITFSGDTSSIAIRVEDFPAVEGRASSGVVLPTAQASVTDPFGAVIDASLSHDGQSTVTLVFTEGKPGAPGIYTLIVHLEDQAGNARSSQVTFPLNIIGRVEFFPPDSSLVRGPLNRVSARVEGTHEPLGPGVTAVMRVMHHGVPVAGTSAVFGDTLIFTLEDTLADDGSADGLYEVFASMGITELGTEAEARAIFTVDNLAPDTARVDVEVNADGVAVVAEFSDGGVYPDVSGIDQGATELMLEEPGGGLIEPEASAWLDLNTLEASFGALQVTGFYRLRLSVRDRGGLAAILSKPVVSSFGPGQGRSAAFVDDVPARTQARIHFISGRSGKRITRAILRIFNLRGDLIRRLDVADRIDPEGTSVSAEWLLENDSGSLVVNGVFIYYWEVTFNDGRTERIRKTLAVARR